ncbi:hypothetical protein EYF80_047568 [Liparis tanakae]|uniref:Uncharacterized protein n=1 Tax=Liparis tanakae TaxID=230148 RepID=A0A4Z2FNC9_9TELE|nr:hypothetical protein EYF80_047568 [Liparis tanakae]
MAQESVSTNGQRWKSGEVLKAWWAGAELPGGLWGRVGPDGLAVVVVHHLLGNLRQHALSQGRRGRLGRRREEERRGGEERRRGGDGRRFSLLTATMGLH